jgi:hypothetical protein
MNRQDVLDRQPTPTEDVIGGTHLFCCRSDVSLCGLNVTGWELAGDREETEPCGPGCPIGR